MKKDTLYIMLGALVLIIGAIIIFLMDSVSLLIYITVATTLIVATYIYIRDIKKSTEKCVSSLTQKIKDANNKGNNKYPIGIIIVDVDKKLIEWANEYIYNNMNFKKIIGEPILEVLPEIQELFENDVLEIKTKINESKYSIKYEKESGYIYFFDITENVKLREKLDSSKPALMVINVDNQEEIYDLLDDEKVAKLDANIAELISEWAKKKNIYIKRIDEDRFLGLLTVKNLYQIEEEKFYILDEIRNLKDTYNTQVTISIGVAAGITYLPELGLRAKKSLDIALGRGGDQVAVKEDDEAIRFYGGKTNPQERRTRVRARVISNALSEIIKDSDKVIVMGHINPDFDSIGACVGIYEFSKLNAKEAYIVLNEEDKDETISKIMQEVNKHENLKNIFITNDQVDDLISSKTTLVVVDTSAPDRVLNTSLLDKITKKVVIDHHRRGEEIIENPLLSYIEPYASSTAELISELLAYETKGNNIGSLSASLMLGGIVVDSQNFTLRTGSRTFDAAAYLRSQGADPVKIKNILKEPLENFLARVEIIKNAYKISDDIMIAAVPNDKIYNNVLLAQGADTLLSIKGIEASFVLGRLDDSTVGISARSLGNLNVQLVMEDMGGGGHLTNAASQIISEDIYLVRDELIKIIEEKIM
ncbi:MULTISPECIES: DHH family phosphoesterase [unclassified Gemella]|uniref:DHH family phosphoesterase n=1 Tax=unclassified Gemella TaxID=2624949 RepID=UPI0010732847|nr:MULTISPECIES: DHH family phosphoesterase [unclassified Gemella]MBF0710513.1 DHH family phosphoesterase [Gemella sp. GL1.1]MBF0746545.1 DHH family phosphoesterase [Gemella sp. 19428wG2_WT2a]NYS27857.1 DHH family phosphoesterase [Gemella sp. GL1]TFU59906.1 DHH family phosphoesterase [Gemella sp. WT2a]